MAQESNKDETPSGWTGPLVGFVLGCVAGAALYHLAKPKVELGIEQLQERREVARLLGAEQESRRAALAAQVRGRRDQQRLSLAQKQELSFQARLAGKRAA